MRPISKVYACAAAVSLLIIYFLFQQPSAGISFSIHSSPRKDMRRIVIFGDDWSDTGTYQVTRHILSSAGPRDPDRGEQWTETLCKEASKSILNERHAD